MQLSSMGALGSLAVMTRGAGRRRLAAGLHVMEPSAGHAHVERRRADNSEYVQAAA
jgi:hypothetical protein